MTPMHERAQATVEFALVLPVVVVLLVGLVQVGRLVGLQVAVIDAARAGARAASVDPRPSVAEAAARVTLARGDRLEVHLELAGGRPRVVTVTATAPKLCAGLVTVIEVADAEVIVAGVVPKLSDVTPARLFPPNVTEVPPPTDPTAGAIEVTLGAS